jgi:DNA-binding PadR family transcriptional regulator
MNAPSALALRALSLAEWTVLVVIAQKPVHGFAVAQLTARDGELGRVWTIPRPIIYRALGRLEEAGLVTAEGTEPGQGPQRTIYAATGEGQQAARRWLQTPVEHIRDIRSQLLLKLALMHRAGEDPAGLIARQRAVLTPIAEAIDADTPSGSFDAVLLAWRRSTAAAALGFLDEISR